MRFLGGKKRNRKKRIQERQKSKPGKKIPKPVKKLYWGCGRIRKTKKKKGWTDNNKKIPKKGEIPYCPRHWGPGHKQRKG